HPIVEQAEPEDQPDSPENEQKKQRERAIEAEKGLPAFRPAHPLRDRPPRTPCASIKRPVESKAARGAARQNDAFKRLPESDGDDDGAGDDLEDHAACSRLAFMVISAFSTRE